MWRVRKRKPRIVGLITQPAPIRAQSATMTGSGTVITPGGPPVPPTGTSTVYPDYYTIPTGNDLFPSDTGVNQSRSTMNGATYRNYGFSITEPSAGATPDNPFPFSKYPGWYINHGASAIAWEHEGGDWYDKNGTKWGTVPYATKSDIDQNQSGVNYNVTFASNADLVQLVQDWIDGTKKNYGFFIKASNSNVWLFRSRFYSDASSHPTLTVTISGVPVPTSLKAVRTVWLNNSGDTPQVYNQQFRVGEVADRACICFDLSSLSGTVTAVTLTLTSYDQFGNNTFNLYRVSNPADQTNISAVELGLAQNYILDANIESHPDVLFTQYFADASYDNKWIVSGGRQQTSWITASSDNNGYSKLLGQWNALKVGQYGAPSGSDNSYNSMMNVEWSPWRNDGTTHIKPLQHCEELYFRYYLMYGNNWNPTINSAGKMPGWDGRYAELKSNTSGDGQVLGSAIRVAGMGRGNGGSAADGVTGWSARNTFARQDLDANVPMYNYRYIGAGDPYVADMCQDNGPMVPWDKYYLPYLEKGKWYCIETRIKMNTVSDATAIPKEIVSITRSGTTATVTTLAAHGLSTNDVVSIGGLSPRTWCGDKTITVTGATSFTYVVPNAGATTATYTGTPPPGVGAQMMCYVKSVGNYDGILEGWVNGRKAYSKTNFRFRHCAICTDGVTPFAIDAVWWAIYDGGQGIPVVGSNNTPYELYITANVVAKSYIGPISISPPLPAWLANQGTNKWIAIAGTQMTNMNAQPLIDAGICPVDRNPFGNGHGKPFAYGPNATVPGGAVWDGQYYGGGTFRQAGNEMITFGGGGKVAWAGNEVRKIKLDVDSPQWVCHTNPSPSTDVWYNEVQNTTATVPFYFSAVDGIAGDVPSAYMRDGVTPNARHSYFQCQFVDNLNQFFLFGCRNTWERDNSPSGNPPGSAPTEANHVDALDWNAGTWFAPDTKPKIPHSVTSDAVLTVKHPTSELIYCARKQYLDEYNPSTNSWRTLYTHATTDLDTAGGAIDATNNKILRFGHMVVSGTVTADVVGTIDLSASPVTYTAATFTGPYAANLHQAQYYWGAGMVWDEGLGKIVYYQDDGWLYTITYVSNSEWAVDRLTMTGTPPAPGISSYPNSSLVAIWNRMQYCRSLKGIVFALNGFYPVYFVKTT